MNTVSTHRTYQLKARAERQRETRERIVAATEALHREVGPARTTIADIARRAGVERLTVYNHFPELTQLLGACQAHFLMRHPPPDISPGVVLKKDALRRFETALTQLYGWYRANQRMEENIHRDRLLLPELDALLRKSSDPVFDGAAAAYARLIARSSRAVPGVHAMVRVALEFGTWRMVSARGASDRQAAKLLALAVAGVQNQGIGQTSAETDGAA
jgi:AcrR family transcriptional regulator